MILRVSCPDEKGKDEHGSEHGEAERVCRASPGVAIDDVRDEVKCGCCGDPAESNGQSIKPGEGE